MHYQVLISGGGIAGLTLALKLVAQGVNVLVVEKDTEPAIKYKGELLQPKSLLILEKLGIIDQVLAHSYPIHHTHVIEHSSSQPHLFTKVTLDYGILHTRYPYAVMIPHETLKQLILEHASQFPHFHMIRPGRVIAIEQHTATLRTPEGERTVSADYIIGAEGKVSVVRKKMNVRLHIQKYNHQFLTLSSPRPLSLNEAQLISNQKRFLGLFPLPDQKVRIVYLIRSGEFRQYMHRGLQPFFQEIIEIVPSLKGYVDQIESWKQIELMVPQKHHANRYALGHLAIIGDAAHSVHPMAGEGMNMAIQDSDILGELISWLTQSNQSDSLGLKWYEIVRKSRAEYVSRISHLSALAYSFPYKWVTPFRIRVLQSIQSSAYLQAQYMINISGIGLCPESIADRLRQLGILSKSFLPASLDQEKFLFSQIDDYPWLKKGLKS
jgi:2-polyprenyl-6-methoxyphenol hydroxylase-like FAD-dependent oxidoreductase